MINFANKIEFGSSVIAGILPVILAKAFSCEDETKKTYHKLFEKQASIELNVPSSFGEPKFRTVVVLDSIISYNLETLRSFLAEDPKHDLFCIDAGGRNHSGDGRAVYMHRESIQALVDYADFLKERHAA